MRVFAFLDRWFPLTWCVVLALGLVLLPTTPPEDSAHRSITTEPAQPLYQAQCQALCAADQGECRQPGAAGSWRHGAACVDQCVSERKLELARATAFGPTATRCQHRINLAVLCILSHGCTAEPELSPQGTINPCSEAFTWALSACQGQSNQRSLF